ncbi:ATP-binding protein, partial [Pseudomonas aeruginosa]|nr:ATP-binding protein [Pseudomonas aeruginosa]
MRSSAASDVYKRQIRYSEIKVSSELALVGQNSSGKSSILRALNSFFNFEEERKNFESGRHSFQKTSIAVITLDFDEVPVACRLPRSGAGSEIRARLKYKKSDVWQIFDGNDWIPAPADFHEELQKYISYVYVPLRRDHEVAGWGDTGLLKRAVEAWLINYTSRRDTISPKVVELSKIVQGK